MTSAVKEANMVLYIITVWVLVSFAGGFPMTALYPIRRDRFQILTAVAGIADSRCRDCRMF